MLFHRNHERDIGKNVPTEKRSGKKGLGPPPRNLQELPIFTPDFNFQSSGEELQKLLLGVEVALLRKKNCNDHINIGIKT